MNRFLIIGLVFTLSLNARAQTTASAFEAGTVTTRDIRKGDHPKKPKAWLTTLYLRPVEEKVVNRTVWPLVPAVLLEADPALSVTTPFGTKIVSQLKKGDVLYHYDEATQRIITWEVGIVQRKSRRAESRYALVTEHDGFLFENRVAMEP